LSVEALQGVRVVGIDLEVVDGVFHGVALDMYLCRIQLLEDHVESNCLFSLNVAAQEPVQQDTILSMTTQCNVSSGNSGRS
jgi:hypothetical protein